MANSRIWRDSKTVPVTDIVEFNEAAIPDTTGGIQQTQITLTSAVAINEKPKGQLDELQDTGLSSVNYVITGFIENPTNSLIPDIIKKWLVEDKTVSTTFPFGRFGLELDDFPHYNVHPEENRGLILSDWNWVRDGETRGKASFVASLRLNSNVTGLNASTYDWTVDTV